VTVTTMSPSLVTPIHFMLPSFPSALRTSLPVAALFFSLWALLNRKRRLSTRLWMTAAGLVFLVGGCGGGSHHVPVGGNPKGSSQLTFTGTSGTLKNSTSVTLMVS